MDNGESKVQALDLATSKQDLAKQFASVSNAGDGGILAQLTGNPFFTAGFGLATLGTLATFGQRGLRKGASLLRQRMLVDVEINVKDESYPWFLEWMTQHQRSQLARSPINRGPAVHGKPIAKPGAFESLLQKFTPRMRHLSIQTEKVVHSNGAIHTRFALLPGPGKHILRYNGAFILVNRTREAKSRDLQTGTPWETITLTTLYGHKHVFEDLFTEAHALAEKNYEGKTVIYNAWSTEWKPFGQPRRKRPLESVVLDEGVKERIVADIQDFINSASWYYDRGIPYRRGYLLYGPPGTGKSSFIQALAGHLDYDIAILNLSERGLTDDRLNHLLTVVPKRTIVLLEDVDAAFSNRRQQTDADGYRGANVTFSGLLNALDGVASAEERILFLTTNHVERLDEALVRPGRVDMTVRLGEATRYQISKLWDRFYGDLDASEKYKAEFLDKLEDIGLLLQEDEESTDEGHRGATGGGASPTEEISGISTAALQGLFLYNKEDMRGAVEMVDGLMDDEVRRLVKGGGTGTGTGDGSKGN
ncbi:putative mitochondrial chaperone bcs1 [Phaeomoniella chlamydospora]|uniref:Putative mitochondrial chaperone bcs1 n=1 Tax=Phaeomoniella chlamydospora TaxID=158046 RepID=A0A0G2G197_PHACM|nr:putative mitochondrial chaperone bcs1 [Phaeomoniella chlamydospora]